MYKKIQLALPVCLFGMYVIWITGSTGTFIANLSESCYRCLCYVATECDMEHGCTGEYCGPFNISHIYWVEAGMVVMPEDSPQRNRAWEDCAQNYECAKKIVAGYLVKLAKDCNGDGVTNCYDFMMTNGNGGYGCTKPLNRTENGKRWLRRYDDCRF